jgi:hypothetical protein
VAVDLGDLRDLRAAGALMLAGAVTLPWLPGHAGLVCPLRAVTGVPCPLCGMTTSVEATVHGRLGEAVAANPAGILAVVLAVALLLFRPRRLNVPPAVPIVLGMAMWVFELHRFSYL